MGEHTEYFISLYRSNITPLVNVYNKKRNLGIIIKAIESTIGMNTTMITCNLGLRIPYLAFKYVGGEWHSPGSKYTRVGGMDGFGVGVFSVGVFNTPLRMADSKKPDDK